MSSIIEFISENIVAIISILVIARFIRAFLSQSRNKEKTKSKNIAADRDSSQEQKGHPRKEQAARPKSSPRNIDAVYPVRDKDRKMDQPQRRNQRKQKLKSQRLTPSSDQKSSRESFQASRTLSSQRVQTELQRKPLEIEEVSETKPTLLGDLHRKERQQRIREAIIMKEILDSPAAIRKVNKRRYLKEKKRL